MRRPSADDTFEDLLRSLRNAAPKTWPKRDTSPLKNAGGKSPSRSSPAVSPRRLALDGTDFAPLDPDPEHVDGDKFSRQVPRSISDPSRSGAVGVPTSRAVARQESRDMFDEVFEKQAMELYGIRRGKLVKVKVARSTHTQSTKACGLFLKAIP